MKQWVEMVHDCYHDPVLSMNGLRRETKNFPYYATKIARKFNVERYYLENHMYSFFLLNAQLLMRRTVVFLHFLMAVSLNHLLGGQGHKEVTTEE